MKKQKYAKITSTQTGKKIIIDYTTYYLCQNYVEFYGLNEKLAMCSRNNCIIEFNLSKEK